MSLWNRRANYYDFLRNVFPINLILRKELRNLQRLLHDAPPTQGWILDVGTGTGTAIHLLPKGKKVVALDSSLAMLAKAKKNENCAAVVSGDAGCLPFKADAFNGILAIGIFEYQNSPVRFLNELVRVLSYNGHIILTYAPKSFLNFLRFLLGHKLLLLTDTQFSELLTSQSELTCIKIEKSLIQRQVLLKTTQPHV